MKKQLERYGQERTPYAMLSRSVAGTLKNSLVLGSLDPLMEQKNQ
ncbi:hypothetical protein [Aquimarina hainanensis]